MINLIPNTAKKKLVREYWLRVLAVMVLALALSGLVMASLCLPTVILLRSLDRSMSDVVKDAKAEQDSFAEDRESIVRTNALVDYLSVMEGENQLSVVLARLDTLAGGHIRLTQFTTEAVDGRFATVNLIGEANTRSDLSNFRDRLEASDMVESVELPISNLAKDENITFTMVVTLRNPQ